MRPKTLILLALALGCGSIAAVGINQVLLANRHPTVVTVEGDQESILVAMADVNMGDLITSEMVKLDKWPKASLPTGALTRIEQIEGRRARVNMFPGDPIVEAKLLSKDATIAGASQFIPKGYRVVAVKVDDISAASNLIKPGDRVDVLLHLRANPGLGINETRTITVLQDIKVFSVNDIFHPNADKADQAIAARTVSMLVTPEQAELVTHATEMGQIRLVMRSAEDDTVAQTSGATQTDLFGGKEHGERGKEDFAHGEGHTGMGGGGNALIGMLNNSSPAQPAPPAPTSVAQAPVRNPWLMILIEADKAEEVKFDDPDRLPTSVQPLGDQTSTPVAGPLPAEIPAPADAQPSAESDAKDDDNTEGDGAATQGGQGDNPDDKSGAEQGSASGSEGDGQ